MPGPQSQAGFLVARQGKMPGDKTPEDVRVGKNIVAAREAAGLIQAELARRVGVQQTTMWRYEHGHHCPLEKLKLIARECKVSVDALLAGTQEVSEPEPLTLTQEEMLKLMQLLAQAAAHDTPETRAQLDKALLAHAKRLRLHKR